MSVETPGAQKGRRNQSLFINQPYSDWLKHHSQTPSNQIFSSLLCDEQLEQFGFSCGEESYCIFFFHANQNAACSLVVPQRQTKVCSLVITSFNPATIYSYFVTFFLGVLVAYSTMDLGGGVTALLVCFALFSVQTHATQVRLHGREYITYELRSLTSNPRETVIKLRFQTIHPNGLLLYSKGRNEDFLQLDIYHGQVR